MIHSFFNPLEMQVKRYDSILVSSMKLFCIMPTSQYQPLHLFISLVWYIFKLGTWNTKAIVFTPEYAIVRGLPVKSIYEYNLTLLFRTPWYMITHKSMPVKG